MHDGGHVQHGGYYEQLDGFLELQCECPEQHDGYNEQHDGYDKQ